MVNNMYQHIESILNLAWTIFEKFREIKISDLPASDPTVKDGPKYLLVALLKCSFIYIMMVIYSWLLSCVFSSILF